MRCVVLLFIVPLVGLAAALLIAAGDRGIADNAAAIDRSVVRILVAGPAGRGSGSGFVVNADGIVVTNFHVISRAQAPGWSIAVPDDPGAEPLQAEILEAYPGEDLALLRVPGLARPPVTFAPADGRGGRGASVAVLGFPGAADRLGPIDEPSLGVGSVARVFEGAWSMGGPRIPIIQHSAPTNPGNSGGPLVDRCGAVIGVNSQREVRILLGPGGVPVVTEQIQGVFYASGVAPLLERLQAAGIAHHIATDRCGRLGVLSGGAAVGLLVIASVALGIAGFARGRRRRAQDILINCRASAEDCAHAVALAISRLGPGGRITVCREPDRLPDPSSTPR